MLDAVNPIGGFLRQKSSSGINPLLIINNQIINIIMTTQTYTEQYDYIYDLLVDKELDEELLDFLYHVPNHEDQMVMIKHPHFSFTIILQHDGEMGIEYQINLINKSFFFISPTSAIPALPTDYK